MTRTADVLTIGEAMLVISPSAGGAFTLDGLFSVSAGGAESNVASVHAALGVDAVWFGALGDDLAGDLVLEDIERSGVDVSAVQRSAGRQTGLYLKAPDRGAVEYFRRDSAAARMRLEDLDGLEVTPLLVHLTGILPALSASCEELARAVIARRVLQGAVVAFDVNHRAALWGDRAKAPELLRDLANSSDIVFVGRDEAERLWGTPSPREIRALLPRPIHLIVKDGAGAATEYTRTEVTLEPALDVDVVEPVGAGDAFAAGWEAGWLAGLPAAIRLQLGHAAAAAALQSDRDRPTEVSAARHLLTESRRS